MIVQAVPKGSAAGEHRARMAHLDGERTDAARLMRFLLNRDAI